MYQLKPEIKERWFAKMDELADRQGRLALVSLYLTNLPNYCALGVLGLACQEVTGQGKFVENETAFCLEEHAEGNCDYVITLDALELMANEFDEEEAVNFTKAVVKMNDGWRYTFAQIKASITDQC